MIERKFRNEYNYKTKYMYVSTYECGSFSCSFFLLLKSVALANQYYYRLARFRHRNMYLIGKDHLPLGKL